MAAAALPRGHMIMVEPPAELLAALQG